MALLDSAAAREDARASTSTRRGPSDRRHRDILRFASLVLADSGKARATADEVIAAVDELVGAKTTAAERLELKKALTKHPNFKKTRQRDEFSIL